MSTRERTRILNAFFLGDLLGTLWGFGIACIIWWHWQVGATLVLVASAGYVLGSLAARPIPKAEQ